MILHPELIPCPGDTWAWDYAAGDAHDQESSCDSSEMSQAHVSSERSEATTHHLVRFFRQTGRTIVLDFGKVVPCAMVEL